MPSIRNSFPYFHNNIHPISDASYPYDLILPLYTILIKLVAKRCIVTTLPFILFDNIKKNHFSFVNRRILTEIFFTISFIDFISILSITYSFAVHTTEYFDGRKVCLLVKFDYNILYGLSVHLYKLIKTILLILCAALKT